MTGTAGETITEHWFVIDTDSADGVARAARRSLLATGNAQRVHAHRSGEACTTDCYTLRCR